jgi:hypothetical protein
MGLRMTVYNGGVKEESAGQGSSMLFLQSTLKESEMENDEGERHTGVW